MQPPITHCLYNPLSWIWVKFVTGFYSMWQRWWDVTPMRIFYITSRFSRLKRETVLLALKDQTTKLWTVYGVGHVAEALATASEKPRYLVLHRKDLGSAYSRVSLERDPGSEQQCSRTDTVVAASWAWTQDPAKACPDSQPTKSVTQ